MKSAYEATYEDKRYRGDRETLIKTIGRSWVYIKNNCQLKKIGVYLEEYTIIDRKDKQLYRGHLYDIARQLGKQYNTVSGNTSKRTTGKIILVSHEELEQYRKYREPGNHHKGLMSLEEMKAMAGRMNWFNNRNYEPHFELPINIEKRLKEAGINPSEVPEVEPHLDSFDTRYGTRLTRFIQGKNYDVKAIGKKLREERLSRGLTLRETSEIVGYSIPYLCHIEGGTREQISYERLEEIADKLGVDI